LAVALGKGATPPFFLGSPAVLEFSTPIALDWRRKLSRANPHCTPQWVVALATAAMLGATSVTAEAPTAVTPGESCVNSSCHADQAKQKFVHTVAADGNFCATCHQPAAGADKHEFTFPAEGAELCYMCHESKVDKKVKHLPAAYGLCTACHSPHQSDNPRQLRFPVEELCTTCHAGNDFKGGKVTHGPVAEGRCIRCHDPHSADNGFMLRLGQPDLCFQCHDKSQKDPAGHGLPRIKALFEAKDISLHPPFASGQCTMCHVPHTGPNTRLLNGPYPASFYAPFSKDAYFCFNCHDATAFTEPRTLESTDFRNGNLNLHYRHVNRQKGRTCRACHHHHGAQNDKLIRRGVAFGNRTIRILKYEKTETGGTCAPMCHTVVTYDRCDPAPPPIKVTAREGKDATAESLAAGCAPAKGG